MVTFTLWSPQATRVELWIYSTAMGADAILKAAMNQQGDGSLTSTVQVASLQAIRPGRRNLLRVPRLGTKLDVSDVDSNGNRFNPK
jgi:hypothetical protein